MVRVQLKINWHWPHTCLFGYQYGHNGPNTAHWFNLNFGYLELDWMW